jgi:hypothetical protein
VRLVEERDWIVVEDLYRSQDERCGRRRFPDEQAVK